VRTKRESEMKRMCALLKVKPGMLEEYKKAHQVWPEMLKAMHDAGIRNYSIFHREDGLLVGYLEADDCEEALRKCAATGVSKRWQKYMLPFFEAVWPGFQPLQGQALTEYFYME
jgi:L-rhamnose mutarotase